MAGSVRGDTCDLRHKPVDAPTLPRLLDIDGVAELLGVNVRHVRRLVAERRIPFVKWGHLLRFDPTDLARWLDASRVDSRR
jgi:excisionase family DNA binding protein